jgi:hypothetical protein
MKLIVILLLLTACDFPNRGDDVSYASYDYAYEVAKHECESKANQSLYDCLKEMDFDNNDLIIKEE